MDSTEAPVSMAVELETFAQGGLNAANRKTGLVMEIEETQLVHVVLKADAVANAAVRLTVFDVDGNVVASITAQGGKSISRSLHLAPGKYLGYGYVQTSLAVGTYLIGRYAVKSEDGRTNKVSHLGFDLLRANILVQALTYGIKYSVQRDRPSGECCSFPSGHASVTFATVSIQSSGASDRRIE